MAVFVVNHRANGVSGYSKRVVAESAEDAIQIRAIELAGIPGLSLVECQEVATTGSRYEKMLLEAEDVSQADLVRQGFAKLRRRRVLRW